jgi:hypothetical protein
LPLARLLGMRNVAQAAASHLEAGIGWRSNPAV